MEVCLCSHCVGGVVVWGFAGVCDGHLLNLECGARCVIGWGGGCFLVKLWCDLVMVVVVSKA